MLAVAQTLFIMHHHYHNAFVFLLLKSIFPFFFSWKNNLSSELTMVHFPHKSKLLCLALHVC